MCIYLKLHRVAWLSKVPGDCPHVSIARENVTTSLWPSLQLNSIFNLFWYFEIHYLDIKQICVSNPDMLASYLFLWAVPSSGSGRNLFWFSDIILPSPSRLTSSAPSVCDISSLQLLLQGGKYLTGVIFFFDNHIIITSKTLELPFICYMFKDINLKTCLQC